MKSFQCARHCEAKPGSAARSWLRFVVWGRGLGLYKEGKKKCHEGLRGGREWRGGEWTGRVVGHMCFWRGWVLGIYGKGIHGVCGKGIYGKGVYL